MNFTRIFYILTRSLASLIVSIYGLVQLFESNWLSGVFSCVAGIMFSLDVFYSFQLKDALIIKKDKPIALSIYLVSLVFMIAEFFFISNHAIRTFIMVLITVILLGLISFIPAYLTHDENSYNNDVK